ncbi:MAG: hypothetical protein VX642_02205 [Bdellovibrionota bacterium]|nr:hypothetical protein [Bdellovibrionota bacterium]
MNLLGKLCLGIIFSVIAFTANAEMKTTRGELLSILTLIPTVGTSVLLSDPVSETVEEQAIEVQTEIAIYEETGEMPVELVSLVSELSNKLSLSFEEAYQMLDQKSFEIVKNI